MTAASTSLDAAMSQIIAAEVQHVAHNYHPLPVVISRGEGAWVTDVEGKRYLDLLSAYSALNFGHGHPAILAAAQEQLNRLTLTSRAYHNDRLGPFAAALAELSGKDLVLPMNTGAEAVETGIKVARAWGYRVKGVAPDAAITADTVAVLIEPIQGEAGVILPPEGYLKKVQISRTFFR